MRTGHYLECCGRLLHWLHRGNDGRATHWNSRARSGVGSNATLGIHRRHGTLFFTQWLREGDVVAGALLGLTDLAGEQVRVHSVRHTV